MSKVVIPELRADVDRELKRAGSGGFKDVLVASVENTLWTISSFTVDTVLRWSLRCRSAS